MAELVLTTEEIEDVIPLYPDLVAVNFKEVFIKQYEELLRIKEELYKTRETSRKLENALKIAESEFNLKSQFFDVKYKTLTKQGVEGDYYTKLLHRKGKVY